jgi:hypothetical protein
MAVPITRPMQHKTVTHYRGAMRKGGTTALTLPPSKGARVTGSGGPGSRPSQDQSVHVSAVTRPNLYRYRP